MKRIACVCLASLLLLCFAGAVSAEPSGYWSDYCDINFVGDGTAQHPYEITNSQQLAGLAMKVNGGSSSAGKYFKLTNSTPGAYDLGAHFWYPIGSFGSSFEGTFDGNNCTILNMNIEDVYYITYAGLFGHTSNADIRNVGVVGAHVTGSSGGGLVGYAYNSNIMNCYATGTVNVVRGYGGLEAGGLVGYADKSNIMNCYATGTVNVVSGYSSVAGGLVGYADKSNIMNCYATGTVTATIDKYSSIDLKVTVGGVVGEASGGSSITRSAALNQRVSTSGAKESYVGRVIGYYSEDTKLTYNYAWKGMQTNGEWTGDNGKSILDPWDNTGFFECTLKFDDNWIMGTRGDYRLPLLKWQPVDSVPGDVTYLRS